MGRPAFFILLTSACMLLANAAMAQMIYQATLAEPNQKTPEISTDELRRILADGSGIVIDARKYQEFINGHIPEAKSAMLEIGEPPADVVVPVILNIVGGDKSKAIVLYCDGPKCMASRKLGEQLADAGFTNVRRYQLGIPMWRLAGGPVAIELEGFRRVYKLDRTAAFFDARSAEDFSKQNLGGSHNIPADKLTAITREMPLPMNDFNTRILLFGRDAKQARALADLMAKTPFQNVSYFSGTFEELVAAALNTEIPH